MQHYLREESRNYMKKDFFYTLLLSLSNILFPIVTFPYASRILGPVGIGKVQMSSSFAQYFGLIAALGIPVYGMQEVAKRRHNKQALSTVFSELTTIYLVTSLIVSVIYLGIIFGVPYFQNNNMSLYLYSGILILFGFTSIDWLYLGLEEFKLVALRSILIKIISVILLFIFVKEATDYTGFLGIILFSIMGNNVLNLLLIQNRTGFRFQDIHLKQHLQPLLFIFATSIVTSMYTVLDTVLLGFLSDEYSVGLYTISTKLTKLALPFIISAGFIMIPKFAMYNNDNRMDDIQKLLNKSWHFIIHFSVPISIGLLILSPEFILAFSNKLFVSAASSMQILSPLPVLIGIGYFFAFQILLPMGKTREIFYSVLGGMFVFLVTNFLLVPELKDKGAAIANLLSEITVSGLYFYFIRKNAGFTIQWNLIVYSLLSTLLFLPIVLLIRYLQLSAITTLLVSVGLCAPSYFIIQLHIFKDRFLIDFLQPYYDTFINRNR